MLRKTEVKWGCRNDKRYYIDALATEAEAAARNSGMKTVGANLTVETSSGQTLTRLYAFNRPQILNTHSIRMTRR